jgi:hypothetical protein
MEDEMRREEKEGWAYCRDTDIAVVVGVESVVADYMKDFVCPNAWEDEASEEGSISLKDLNTDELMQDVWESPTADEKLKVLTIAFRMTDKNVLQWGKNSVYRPRENVVEVVYSDAVRIVELIDNELHEIYSSRFSMRHGDISPDERKCELLTLRKSIVDKIDMSRLNINAYSRDLMAYSTRKEGVNDTEAGKHANVHGEP